MSATPVANSQTTTRLKGVVSFGREIVAIAVWLLIIIKVFVYDVDLLLVNKVPWLKRLYPYKFFLLIGFIAIVWATLGRRTWRIIGYITVYPLVLLFWRVPKILFRNWALLLIFTPAIESLIITFKRRFVLASLTMLSVLALSLTQNRLVLIGCMVFLLIYLLIHYILRLRVAFRPTSLFANIAPAIRDMWRHSIKTFKQNEFQARSGPGAEPSDYQKKHIENVKTLYLQNLLWTYVGKKLDEAVSSRRTDLYFIVALVYSFVLTVTVFGFEYWALFKIDPSSFQKADKASFWSFLLFSFNAILHTGFSTVFPVSGAALTLANLELGASLIVGLFFVFILFTSSRDRYRQELKSVVDHMSASAYQIERFLQKDLKMRLIDAEAKIIAADPSFSNTMQSFGRTPPPNPTK